MTSPSFLDLDTFLASLESKLRGSFSSLELSLEGIEDLQKVEQIITKADKVVAMRILIGLLGLAPQVDQDEQVWNILQTSQTQHTDSWVKVMAGIVQGIMFPQGLHQRQNMNTDTDINTDARIHDGDTKDTTPIVRGEEAERRLQATCDKILQQVMSMATKTMNQNNNNTTNSNNDTDRNINRQQNDLDPTFVPYRFMLVSNQLRTQLLPGLDQHYHFAVNHKAPVLHQDAQEERNKAKDDLLHTQKQSTVDTRTLPTDAAPTALPTFPGMRTTGARKTGDAKKTSSSLFVTRKPTLPSQTGGGLRVKKTAQSIVGQRQRDGVGGRALKSKTSRMQVLNTDDVKQINATKTNDGELPPSKRLKKMVASSSNTKTKNTSTEKETTSETNDPVDPQANAIANAALSAYQQKQQQQQQQQVPKPRQQDWQTMLQEKNNRLSDEHRQLIEQFFTHQNNPTGESKVKVKLHEERSIDPETNKEIKETFYLELDYDTFTSKQSKKIKRYN